MAAMDTEKQLPPLPAAAPGRAGPRRKPAPGLVLKPESPWATRIRELLNLKQEGSRYVPSMPVARARGLCKSVRKFTRRDGHAR